MNNETYLFYYFTHFATAGFDSYQDFAATVGPRPDSTFFLKRITANSKERGVPMTPDNFVWITETSVEKARGGELSPPKFPEGTRTSIEQKINDVRFEEYTKGIRAYAEKRQEVRDRRERWEADLTILMDQITSYVTARGYSEHQALDPKILPVETYPKLNAARKQANLLMQYINGQFNRLSSLEKLQEAHRVRREQDRAAMSLNRAYTGKRGRPFNRFVKVRTRITNLTPEQRQHFGIPDGQDFVLVSKPDGRRIRVWTVEVTVPNPKLPQNQSAPQTSPSIPADNTQAI